MYFVGEKVEAVYFGGFLCNMKSSYSPTCSGVHSSCLILLIKALWTWNLVILNPVLPFPWRYKLACFPCGFLFQGWCLSQHREKSDQKSTTQQSAAGGSLAHTPPHIHLLLGGKTSLKTVFFHMPSTGHISLARPLEQFLKPIIQLINHSHSFLPYRIPFRIIGLHCHDQGIDRNVFRHFCFVNWIQENGWLFHICYKNFQLGKRAWVVLHAWHQRFRVCGVDHQVVHRHCFKIKSLDELEKKKKVFLKGSAAVGSSNEKLNCVPFLKEEIASQTQEKYGRAVKRKWRWEWSV